MHRASQAFAFNSLVVVIEHLHEQPHVALESSYKHDYESDDIDYNVDNLIYQEAIRLTG